jgi:hypothetical protein
MAKAKAKAKPGVTNAERTHRSRPGKRLVVERRQGVSGAQNDTSAFGVVDRAMLPCVPERRQA